MQEGSTKVGRVLEVGGELGGTELWPDYRFDFVERYPEARKAYGDPEFQRSLQPEVARRPRIYVRASGWYDWWVPVPVGNESVTLRPELADAGSTWDSMLEVERLLIEPYVARAVERRFGIKLETRERDGRAVLVPREERVWLSILAPIYLQLFEALRRISEGEPGAAVCHECGRPFIVLDARRRFFCNERERFRHAKRQQRRRLSAEPPEIDTVLDLLDQQFDEEERAERAVKADLAAPDPWLPEKTAKALRRRKRYR